MSCLEKAMLAKLASTLSRLTVGSRFVTNDLSVCAVVFDPIRQYSSRSSRSRRRSVNPGKDNLNRFKILSANDKSGRGGAYFNLGRQVEKNFALRGRSHEFEDDLSNEDPQKMLDDQVENDDDLVIYARNKNDYHQMVIEEDKQNRRRTKMSIIKKKMEMYVVL